LEGLEYFNLPNILEPKNLFIVGNPSDVFFAGVFICDKKNQKMVARNILYSDAHLPIFKIIDSLKISCVDSGDLIYIKNYLPNDGRLDDSTIRVPELDELIGQ
jgi:hypothetical protein